MRLTVSIEPMDQERKRTFFATLKSIGDRRYLPDRGKGACVGLVLKDGFNSSVHSGEAPQGKKRKGTSSEKEMPFLQGALKWLPSWNRAGNKLVVERVFSPTQLTPPAPGAPIGAMLRFFRRCRGLTVTELAAKTGVSHNVVSRTERNKAPQNIVALGRLLDFFCREIKEFFPGISNIVDRIIEPKTFGAWLRNFRFRRGLQQKVLAQALGVSNVCISRYEHNAVKPGKSFLKRLETKYQLGPELERFRSLVSEFDGNMTALVQ